MEVVVRIFAVVALVCWVHCPSAIAKDLKAEQSTGKTEPTGVSSGDLAPLNIELPEPPFESIAGWGYSSPNFEEPSYKSRAPFLAPKAAKSVSRGKPVTASSKPKFGTLDQVTDGIKGPARSSGDWMKPIVELEPGTQWVQIDLGSEHCIFAIVVWHFYLYGPVCHDVIIQVSDDPEFRNNVQTITNNDWDNSSGLGKGTDKEYLESSEGRLFDAKGVRARYVRIHGNGSYYAAEMNFEDPARRFAKGSNHFIEVEVFGQPLLPIP